VQTIAIRVYYWSVYENGPRQSQPRTVLAAP